MWFALISTVLTASAGDMHDISCWDATVWDLDGDGYADDAAHTSDRVPVSVRFEDKGSCPAGYVKARGDCDDSNPDVHPRQWEVPANGLDDDCNGLVDDHGFYYRTEGNNVTDDSFDLHVRLHDGGEAYTTQRSMVSQLSYEITYQDLTDTSVELTTGLRVAPPISLRFGAYSAHLTLDDLEDGHVYRAKVQFYRTVTLQSPSGATLERHTALGSESDWYYSMTSSRRALFDTRADIVNRAFYERFHNNLELVGYLGTIQDGTRYHAEPGEAWCSEFYSYVGDQYLADMGHLDSWPLLMDWFEDRDNLVLVDSTIHGILQWLGKPGDYLALDTDDEEGTNHSGMFLAFDQAQGKIITIEGNTSGRHDWSARSRAGGNEVSLRSQPFSNVTGWGWLDRDME